MMRPLDEQEFMVLDCQSTGASPDRGYLLELAWARCSGISGCGPVRDLLVRLPDGSEIPDRVSKLTGIVPPMMAAAVDPGAVWRLLQEDADSLGAPAPCLIHYARFELPFLNRLHSTSGPGQSFPLRVICLHEIARRLFPELPRRGLRALAGFWGFSVGELKRAGDHVRASAHIWSRLARELESRGIAASLGELDAWLKTPWDGGSRRDAFSYPIPKELLQKLPDAPGVYRFFRSNGDVLYVGKARSLKQRVRSYFGRRPRHAEHILEMVTQAARVEVMTTSSAVLAAVLESDEIKRLNPPYNKLLRNGGREIAFFDDALSASHVVPAEPLRHGPVAAPEMVLAAGSVVRLAGGDGPGVPELQALLPWARGAADGVLFDGFSLWKDRWSENLSIASTSRFVVQAARAIIRASDASEDTAEEGTGTDDPPAREESEEKEWTADDVADALDSIIREAGRQLDRGAWLKLLSVSRVRWRRGKSRWRCLLVSDWEVRESGDPGEWAPIRRDSHSPARAVEPGDFDRVRVLSTELKRLCREGVEVEVLLAPNRVLRGAKLAEILRARA